MHRRLLLIFLTLSCVAAAPQAQAGIPIPCMSSKFLKVEDPPRLLGMTVAAKSFHYNVFGCRDGQWDGYSGTDGSYKALTPAIRAALPAAPGFWTSAWRHPTKFWVEWLWIVVGSVCTLGYLLTVLGKALEGGAGSTSTGTSRPGTPRSTIANQDPRFGRR